MAVKRKCLQKNKYTQKPSLVVHLHYVQEKTIGPYKYILYLLTQHLSFSLKTTSTLFITTKQNHIKTKTSITLIVI